MCGSYGWLNFIENNTIRQRYRKILVKNHRIFQLHRYLTPPLGWLHWNFTKIFGVRKLESQVYYLRLFNSIYSYFLVDRSLCYNLELCKNTWTNPDAVWSVDLSGLKEPRRSPCERAILRGKRYLHGQGLAKEQDQQFSYKGIRAVEKRRTKCISVAGINYVEKCQNVTTYLVINCVHLRTFWRPLGMHISSDRPTDRPTVKW